jgi:hypothetical protein
MKMNVPIEEATDADRAKANRTFGNRTFGNGDLPSAPGAAISRRNSFPLRTLMVCFTAWLIATEVLIFDQVKSNANAALLEQAARALRGPEVVIPSERSPNFPSGSKMQNL